MVLPHSGNWDAAAVWFIDFLGGPFMTVAERLKPESLYRRFLEYRESLGMRVVPLTGGPRPSSEVLRDWLADGGSTCLLVDRNLGIGGVPVTVLRSPGDHARRERRCWPRRPARRSSRPSARSPTRGWRLTFAPEVPVGGPGRLKDRVGTAMQAVADAFATTIARAARGLAHAGPDLERRAAGPARGGPPPAPALAEEPA